MYVTCYICQVGALSKAEDILEWNMGLVLTYARILFQSNEIQCHGRLALAKLVEKKTKPSDTQPKNITLMV